MNHGKARTEGKTRYCFHHQGFALTDGFRSLPGMKRRMVCEDCHAKIMAARQRVNLGGIDAEKLPF